MGVNASRQRFLRDADAGVVLRASGSAAVTATATDTAVSLKQLDAAYWDNYELPVGVMAVVFNVTAITTSGDATYDIAVQIDDTSGHSDTPVVLQSVRIAGTGTYVFYLDAKTIEKLNTDHSGTDQWLASKVTIGGTTGKSITYEAFIAKSLGAGA
jgi:hypothetical protein